MSAKVIWPVPPDRSRSALFVYGFFLAAGLALVILLLLVPLYRSYIARSWREVPCRILTSTVESKGDAQGGTTYKTAITYSYVVNGREYRGDRYDFFPVANIGYRSKAHAARQYATGTERHCLVNPDDPAQAVLTRRLGAQVWLGLVPLLFVMAGGFGIIEAVRHARRRASRIGESDAIR